MIKVVIFDIGGVTIKYPMHGIYRDVSRRFKVSKSKVRKNYNALTPLIETNKISEEDFWSRLAKGLDIKRSSALKKVWLASLKKHSPLNHQVVRLIESARENGYKVATISNVSAPHEKLHRRLGQYKFFDRLFLSNRLGMKKPDVRIYRYSARRLKVKPEECVFIDDMQENIAGARKAGMKAILFKNATKLEKDLKKYL